MLLMFQRLDFRAPQILATYAEALNKFHAEEQRGRANALRSTAAPPCGRSEAHQLAVAPHHRVLRLHLRERVQRRLSIRLLRRRTSDGDYSVESPQRPLSGLNLSNAVLLYR